MPEISSSTTLLLRMRPAQPDAPDLYPVEVTLDGAGTFSAAVTLKPDVLADLESSPWEYGRQLGQALFADAGLQRALAYARGKDQPVSVSLQVDAPSLRDLLWERLILATGAEEIAFATSTTIALSRRIPSETPALPPGEGPFRLLLVIASPRELGDEGPFHKVDTAAEIAALRSAWDHLVQRGQLRVRVLARMDAALATELRAAGYAVDAGPATLDAIADQLSSVDSLHVIAHGVFRNDAATLLLEDPDGGSDATPEADLLGRIGDRGLRLVFLQACQSAARTRGTPNALSGLAPKLARRAAGVVAMQDVVRMDDARRFAREFYDTLLARGCADHAANAGRRALYRPDSRSWGIPALYLAPRADPLWQPDAVLAAVQDLAAQFRARSDARAPFPIEVIRQWPGISSKMETSPPGPRVRVLDAIGAVLFPEHGERSAVTVIAGNHGRAKTAQLQGLYAHYAGQLSRGEGPLPFYLQISDVQATDDTPEQTIANAIARTYHKCDIELRASQVLPRLSQPFLLCVDGDQEADIQQRSVLLDALRQLTGAAPHGSAVVTVDEQALAQVPALAGTDPDWQVPVFLVQLLSPATVAQYLTGLGERYTPLLSSIQSANLFDLAGVPWLLAHLLRQAPRGTPSRSGVIGRVVDGNFAGANLPGSARRLVADLLGRVAWAMQAQQATRLDGHRLYEVLDQVRGRREMPLEQLKSHALDTRMLAPSTDDGVRFSYPGFQSYWCARHLLDAGDGFARHLDDITATLGRRSRVRLWEDTLVLLAGMMPSPDRLIRRVLAGSSMGYGEQAFLAARCINEARLAGRPIEGHVIDQVLDSLVWRSTPMKESSAAVRIRATECLGLLRQPASIPHLVSLAVERVRPTYDKQPAFELSGLRHAAVQVLLTMQDEAERHLAEREGGATTPRGLALRQLIASWRAADGEALRRQFDDTRVEGVPAIIAFALGTLGGSEHLAFLADRLLGADTAPDTRWSIADALLLFDPAEVTSRVVRRLAGHADLHVQAAYMIGRLRVASAGTPEWGFLVGCLQADDVRTRGVALRSLAQLGALEYRELCEQIAVDAWAAVARRKDVAVPKRPVERLAMRVAALESLRLIGNGASLLALREARTWRPQGSASDRDTTRLMQLSYEVSEDIYWRLTGGQEGDVFDPSGDLLPSR